MTMGDRVAVMQAGQLQQLASPTEFYDRPANVFVAVLHRLAGDEPVRRHRRKRRHPGGRRPLRPPEAQLRAAQGHGKLIAGIRPEHLTIGDGELTVKVALVEDLGSDSYVYGHLADDPATASSSGPAASTPAPARSSRSPSTPTTFTCSMRTPACGSANEPPGPPGPVRNRQPRGDMMRAVIWEAPGKLTVTEAADPAPRPGELVIQVGACGICGTDVHIADGEFPPTPYPIIPGHEFAGRVVARGEGVAGDWREGERVAVDPSLFCGHCPACRGGRGNLCANWNAIGNTVNGAFAEYVAVPAANAYRHPGQRGRRPGSADRAAVLRGARAAPRRPGHRRGHPADRRRHHGPAAAAAAQRRGRPLGQRGGPEGGPATGGQGRSARPASRGCCRARPRPVRRGGGRDGRASRDRGGVRRARPRAAGCWSSAWPAGRHGVAVPFRIYNDEITVLGSMAVLNSFGAAADLMAAGAIDTARCSGRRSALAQFPAALASVRGGEGIKLQVEPWR